MKKVAEDKELEAKVKRIATVKGLREPTIVCVIAETMEKRRGIRRDAWHYAFITKVAAPRSYSHTG